MSGFIQNQLRDAAGAFFGSDYLRDYTHASQTFRTNTYENAPKLKFNFHVYFEINPDVNAPTDANFSLLVKTVKLPSFNFETHVMNQYNRKRIVQSKIKYDPIDIQFHDDNGNLINSMWYRYYTYYYNDATKPKVLFQGSRGAGPQSTGGTTTDYDIRTQYTPENAGNQGWGYIGETSRLSGPNPTKVPFFKNITIFGMNRHNFIAYTLINPIITRFGHDTYAYSEGAGTMENSMTLDYETVVYNQGKIDGQNPDNIVSGFGQKGYYDRTVSPIAVPGSNGNILGQNGLVAGAGGAIEALASGNLAGAAKIAGVTYNTFKNINLKNTLKAEVTNAIQGALLNNANPTRNTQWDIPKFGASPSTSGTAGAPSSGQTDPTKVSPTTTAGTQIVGK
jgi:hypothetical protein